MRPKKGFTLIELMIVVAVMGVMLLDFPHLETIMTGQSKLVQETIDESRSLTMLYTAIKEALKDKNVSIAQCRRGVLLLDNDVRISVANDGKIVKVGQREIRLGGLARFSGFRKMDDKTVMTLVNTGRDDIVVYWRIGT